MVDYVLPREATVVPTRSWLAAPPGGEPPQRPDQPEVADRVRDLCAPLRLEVGEEFEPARVIGVVVHPGQRGRQTQLR